MRALYLVFLCLVFVVHVGALASLWNQAWPETGLAFVPYWSAHMRASVALSAAIKDSHFFEICKNIMSNEKFLCGWIAAGSLGARQVRLRHFF